MTDVVVAGGAGYIGGELLRLLLLHPRVAVRAATSRSHARRPVAGVHPNLRGVTDLLFSPPDAIPRCDVLFVAVQHGGAAALVEQHGDRADVVIDLSADFRRTGAFTCGWPERHRDALRDATRVSVPGCMATAAMLALYPLAAADLVEPDVTVDARTGSSGAGADAEHNLHAERSGAMRVFAPTGHRHEAEIAEATGLRVRMSATGVEAVRGVQVLCRARAREPIDERALRSLYRDAYESEPFVRVIAQRRGAYRYPEPKILAGSNYCDVGFAVDPGGRDIVAIAALDNLMKGGAGNAVQCLNVRMGWPERTGLEFPGLHPV